MKTLEKPPEVRVAIIGLKHQDLITENQIVQALAILPEAHLEGLLCVKFDLGRDVPFSGWYDPSQKGIEIFSFRDEEDFFELLFHEIAHHVFRHILTIDERAMWVNEVSRLEGYVSDYAQKNTHEDFAECYAAYVMGNPQLLEAPAKIRFMDRMVFGGLCVM